MTIIAYKDGIMAADTQITAFNAIYRASKIVKLPDGGVAGGCGVWHRAWGALEWMRDERTGKAPNIKDACILIVKGDGMLYIAEDEWWEYPLLDTFTAIGCGADAAVSAMRLGKTAKQAVEHVIGQDAMCGERVQTLALDKLKSLSEIKTHTPRKRGARR